MNAHSIYKISNGFTFQVSYPYHMPRTPLEANLECKNLEHELKSKDLPLM